DLEKRTPCGHVRRSVSRDTRTETQDGGDIVVREFAAMALGESGEIGRGNLQRIRSGTVSLSCDAMTGRAILLVHIGSRGNERRRKLRLLLRRILRSQGSGKQHRAAEKRED